MKTQFRQIIAVVLIAVGVFFVLRATVQSFIVVGSSMEPTLQDGDRLIVNKMVYHLRDPKAGEVIVFHPPTGRTVDFIKRIMAAPGDTIEVKGGRVWVNGVTLTEPYIMAPPGYDLTEEQIPPGQYFVLGDNRNNSNDSHSWGTVPRENIIGEATILLWPPGVIPQYTER